MRIFIILQSKRLDCDGVKCRDGQMRRQRQRQPNHRSNEIVIFLCLCSCAHSYQRPILTVDWPLRFSFHCISMDTIPGKWFFTRRDICKSTRDDRTIKPTDSIDRQICKTENRFQMKNKRKKKKWMRRGNFNVICSRHQSRILLRVMMTDVFSWRQQTHREKMNRNANGEINKRKNQQENVTARWASTMFHSMRCTHFAFLHSKWWHIASQWCAKRNQKEIRLLHDAEVRDRSE